MELNQLSREVIRQSKSRIPKRYHLIPHQKLHQEKKQGEK